MFTKHTIKLAFIIASVYFFTFLFTRDIFAATAGYQKCVLGSSCSIGEYLYDDSYDAVTTATCTLTSRYPDGSLFLNAQAMTASAEGDGWYSYSFDTTGKTLGIYRSQITCVTGGDTMRLDKTYIIENPSISTSEVSSAVWDAQTSSHNTDGSFGKNLQSAAPSADTIWNNPTRTLTSYGTLVSDIWNYTTRSLNTFGTLVADIWSNGTRTLTGAHLEGGGDLAKTSDLDTTATSITTSIKGASNKDLTQLDTSVSTAQSSLNSIEGKIDTLNTKADTISTNTSSVLSKWGSYTASDIIGYVDSLETGLGATSDTCSENTIFGGIRCVRDKWGAQTADAIYTAANNAASTATSLRNELDYNGKSTTAYEDLQSIKTYVTTINTSVGDSGDTSASNTIFGKIQGTREDVSASTTSIKGPSNKNLTEVSTQVAGVQTTADTINGKVDDLSTQVSSVDTKASTLLSKWGVYSVSDILSSLTSVTSGIGTSSDACAVSSVFGGIKCIRDKWGSRTAEDLYTSASNAETAATSLRAELNYNGKSTTAYEDLQTLITNIDSVQSLIGSSSDASSVASLYGRLQLVQETVEDLDTSGAGLSDLLDKWGSYTATDIYNKISNISTTVTYSNSIPDVSEILTLSKANASDLQSLKNSVLALQALTAANKTLLQSGGVKPIIQTWLEEGSIIFKTLITNPSSVRQKIPIKFYLPKEATDKDIEKIDEGLKVRYDTTEDAYYVTGEVDLGANQTHIFSVEVTDVWKISNQELESLKLQAKELYDPLKGTSYFGQGALLYSDVVASLDTANRIQNEAQTPEARIKAYREALVNVSKAKSEVESLKTLATSANSSLNFLGFVGGVQTLGVWGLIIVLIGGFVFLAYYMRAISGQGPLLLQRGSSMMNLKHHISKVKEQIKKPTIPETHKKSLFHFGIALGITLAVSVAVIFGARPVSQLVSSFGATHKKDSDVKIGPTPTKAVSEKLVRVKEGTEKIVNVRKGPGVKFEKSSVAVAGKEYPELTRETDASDQEWVKLQVGSSKGWVRADYLEKVDGESASSSVNEVQLDDEKQVLGVSTENGDQVMILTANTTGVNLREGPSVLTKSILKVTSDIRVKRINNLEGWTEVEISSGRLTKSSLRGWVYNSYIGSIDK